MTPLLLAAAEDREASPVGLVIILFLLVAVVLLIRSMNRHLRRLPASFADRDEHGRLLGGGPATGRPEPDGRVDGRPGADGGPAERDPR